MLRTPYSSGTTTRYAVPITERTRSTPYLVSCIRRSHERPAAGCARRSIIQSSERWHLAAYCPFNIPVLHTASSEVRSTGVISWCHSLSSLVSDHSCRAGSLPFGPPPTLRSWSPLSLTCTARGHSRVRGAHNWQAWFPCPVPMLFLAWLAGWYGESTPCTYYAGWYLYLLEYFTQ